MLFSVCKICGLAYHNSELLPTYKKVIPGKIEIGEGISEHSETAKDYYRRAYFEAIDFVVEAVNNRFKQKGYNMLQNLETLLTTENHQSALKEVTEFYTSDFIPDCLQSQLSLFHSSWDPKIQKDLKSVISFLQSLSAVKKEYFSEVIKVIKLILVMPATNATSERSFSALRRVKTWLRSTTSQVRLNWCMLLYVHKTERIVYLYRPLQMSLLQSNQSFWTIQTINNAHYTFFFHFYDSWLNKKNQTISSHLSILAHNIKKKKCIIYY